MNCCNKGNHDTQSKSKWMWICGFSVATFLLAFFVFKVSLGSIFFYAILLACPVMHLLMMKGMGHGDKK